MSRVAIEISLRIRFVWRQSEFAFFGALTSVGALFYFILFYGGNMGLFQWLFDAMREDNRRGGAWCDTNSSTSNHSHTSSGTKICCANCIYLRKDAFRNTSDGGYHCAHPDNPKVHYDMSDVIHEDILHKRSCGNFQEEY